MNTYSAFEMANLYVEPIRELHDRDLEEVRDDCKGHTFLPEENQFEPCTKHGIDCPNDR